MTKEECEVMTEKVIRFILDQYDLEASFTHYLVFNELKAIMKEDLIK